GGFGIFYDLGSNMAAQGYYGFPFQSSYVAQLNVPFPLAPALAQQQPFPTVALPLNTAGDLYALNPDLTLPYTMQWNIGVEQALGERQAVSLSYVASAGRNLTITQRLNVTPSTAIITTGTDRSPYRPNPNFGDILYVRNTPTSDYESLQAQY